MLEVNRLGVYSKYDKKKTIIKMYNILEERKTSSEALIRIAYVDIDGTLTDDNHRKHFLKENEHPDYISYQMECVHDPLNEKVCSFINDKEYDFIILLSGRYYDYLDVTLDQLSTSEEGLKIYDKLIGVNMRSTSVIGTVPLKQLGIRRGMHFLENVYADICACEDRELWDVLSRRLVCHWDVWEDFIRLKQLIPFPHPGLYSDLYHNIQFFLNNYYIVTKDSYTEEIYNV